MHTHTCMQMATKTISITEEAYRVLARLKKEENDSFSRVINRELGKKKVDLKKYFGMLSKKEGDKLERNIKKIREMRAKADRERVKRLQEMLA